jgi:hypothetical protein
MEKLAVMIYELTANIVRTDWCVNLYHGRLYMVAFLLNGEQGLDNLHGHLWAELCLV